MWFCFGLAIATALLINTGCATVHKDPLGIMEQLEQELETEEVNEWRKNGWVPIDKSGYYWEYWARTRYNNVEIVAKCVYTYIKVSGVEKWKGTYYGTPTDLYWSDPPMSRLDGLHSCISWVNHHMNGDYFI